MQLNCSPEGQNQEGQRLGLFNKPREPVEEFCM